MISGIEAVFFDLDDTLWEVGPVIERAEQRIYEHLAAHFPRITQALDITAVRNFRNEAYAARPDLVHNLTASRQLAFEKLLADFDYDPANALALTEIFLDYRNRVALYPDVMPALAGLRSMFKLVVVTNGNADIARVGIDEMFAAQVRAEEAGCKKPARRIFQLACDAVGVVPASVVHVGDHPVDDVQGAIEAGIRSIWVNRRDQHWRETYQPDAEVSDLTGLVRVLTKEL